jgi:hypothetical protein
MQARKQPEQKRIYFRRSDILREWPEREERVSHHFAKPLNEADLTKASSEDEGITKAAGAEGVGDPPQTTRRRGRKDTVFQHVLAAMKADMARGEPVCEMLEKKMEARYRASRDTCRKARKELCPPLSKNEFRQLTTIDK